MREEHDIAIAIHGLLPVFVDIEGRSLKKADNEIRKLIHAIYWIIKTWPNKREWDSVCTFDRIIMTAIDIIWEAVAPKAVFH